MKGEVVVRLYQPGDLEAIRALHDRTPPAGSSQATAPQPWPDDLDRIEQAYLAFWVVVDNHLAGGDLIGMAGIQAAGPDVPNAVLLGKSRVARLKRMRVAPERQRQGVGVQLTETAITWARAHGFSHLILETTPQQIAAMRLYERMRFSEVCRSSIGTFELVWLERALG